MSKRAYYSAPLNQFLTTKAEEIIGELAKYHSQDLVHQQTGAWLEQIHVLQDQLRQIDSAYICFELLIPRMGKRADVVLVVKGLIFVIEFKAGEQSYKKADLRQAQGYALDLSCFHEASHDRVIVPILVATNAPPIATDHMDGFSFGVLETAKANRNNLKEIIQFYLCAYSSLSEIEETTWLASQYKPTPTIVEAAQALYRKHDVKDIARSDADAINLSQTVGRLNQIVHESRISRKKSICFVTGVPGAGKTLVGLQMATSHNNINDEEHAVFLSGNGPLVDVLREALARDKTRDKKCSLSEARRETATFIQNIHHFRDDALKDKDRPPIEKVVIFDEAQRAWDEQKASEFMQKKRGQVGFNQSEPEFLISVMDRHQDWCVIIALVGGGQEINTGEAGLNGWLMALNRSFSQWHVFYSDKLTQAEYAGGYVDSSLINRMNSYVESCLHLSTSMRSFRAERLSHFIHYVIHNESDRAFEEYKQISDRYPIYVTRDLQAAKSWIRRQTKGMETSGLLASAGAKRLKAQGIFVDNVIAPEVWFLNDFEDVRSSHFLEDSATEFVVQGLELDWCLVGWDADYRHNGKSFEHWSFKGTKWIKVKKVEKLRYLENSYRVLLTRARQGMIIYVPYGDDEDATRKRSYYDYTYSYLQRCGLNELKSD